MFSNLISTSFNCCSFGAGDTENIKVVFCVLILFKEELSEELLSLFSEDLIFLSLSLSSFSSSFIGFSSLVLFFIFNLEE